MRIDQLSDLSQSPVTGARLLDLIMAEAPIMEHAAWRLEAFNHFHESDLTVSTGSGLRAKGSAPQKDLQVFSPVARTMAILEREHEVDSVDLNDALSGRIGPKEFQMRLMRAVERLAITIGNDFNVKSIQGTDAASPYDGLGLGVFLKNALAAGQTAKLGWTAAQLAAWNTEFNSSINSDANVDSLIEKVRIAGYDVPGQKVVVMPNYIRARFATRANNLHALQTRKNEFGTDVDFVNGMAIVGLDEAAMPMTESNQAASLDDCGSLFIVRFAEYNGAAFTTNSGLKFTDFEQVEALSTGKARLQLTYNFGVYAQDAIRRISAISKGAV
jgi:hypothetical protein